MLRTIAKRFAIGSLKGRHAVRDWQSQPGMPHRNKELHRAPDEELKEQQSKVNKEFDEDFRVKLFDLEPKVKPADPIPDPVFGLDVPSPIPIASGLIAEVFRQDTDESQFRLSGLRQDYLPFCVGAQTLNDSALQGVLDGLIAAHAEFCRSKGKHFDHISEEDLEEFFATRREDLVKLEMLARETGFSNLIPLIIALRFNARLMNGSIFRVIEERLAAHLHLFSLRELALIKFGTEASTPKPTSRDFRTKLRKKILSMLDLYKSTLSVRDFLYVFTAFRLEWNNYTLHYKFMAFIKFNAVRITKACAEDPTLAIDFLYTFANCRLPKRFRKLMFQENELDKETELVMDIVQKSLTASLRESKEITPSHVLRLLTSISVLGLSDYEEIFHLLDKQLIRMKDQLVETPFLFADIINLLANSNGRRQVPAAGFLALAPELSSKLLPRLIETDLSSALKVVSGLVKYRLVDFRSTKKIFDALFASIDSQEVGYRNLSTASFIVLALFALPELKIDPTSLENYSRITFRKISSRKEFVPLNYWRDIKQFCFMVAHLYPAWRMDHVEILCYHAEKRFNTSRLRPKLMTADLQSVASLMPTDFESKLLPLGDFHNLFLIDFAARDIKLAIRLISEDSLISGSTKEAPKFSVYHEIHGALIRLDDWTLCDIHLDQFNDMKANRAVWLKEQVTSAYKLAVEKSRPHVHELKLQAIKRMAAFAHTMFEDKKHKETYYAGEKFRAVDKLIGFYLDFNDPSRNELQEYADLLRLLEVFMKARGIATLTPEILEGIFEEIETQQLDEKTDEELMAMGFSLSDAEKAVNKYRHYLELAKHSKAEHNADYEFVRELPHKYFEDYEGFEEIDSLPPSK